MTLTRLLLLAFVCSRFAAIPASGAAHLRSEPVSDTLQRDTILRIDAKPEAGFRYPYYIFIPAHTVLHTRHFLLVETNNTGLNDTLAFHDRNAKLEALRNSSGNSVSRALCMPFLVPVLPRSQAAWKVYTHALDRDAMLLSSGPEMRLDLQLIAMVKDAGTALEPFGIVLQPKIMINGFSASGTFANRFTLLHPGMVQAVACGGINAMPMLPVNKVGNTRLLYPLGLYDIEKVSGALPDMNMYKKIPQFIYMGQQDTNDAVQFEDAYSNRERETIYKVLGKTMLPDRWEKCKSIYIAAGANAKFTLYPGIGHGTNRQMNQDIADFFKEAM